MTTAHAALLLLALTGAALAGPAQPRRPLEHAGEVLLQDFVPQEPAELSPINTPVDRQSGGGFSPEFPTIQAGQPLPDLSHLRRKRQIAQKLRDMLNAPYGGQLPTDLGPLMRDSVERAQHVQQFNAIRRSQQAFQPEQDVQPVFQPQRDRETDRSSQPAQRPFPERQNPTAQFPTQQDFRQEQDFRPQDFRPQEDFRPQQDFRPQEDFRREDFRPNEDFRREDFRQEQDFQRQQNFRPEPNLGRRPRPTRQPQNSGFVPENGGFPTSFFGQIRRNFFGARPHSRQKRSAEAPRNEAGFFEMPPNFPNMETLRGFSSTFDGSQSAVNNIDVPGIQFPQSPFQTSRQDDQEPLFQNSPGLS